MPYVNKMVPVSADIRPLPGRPVPYHFSEPEIRRFLNTHATDYNLSVYLDTQRPPWGVLVQEPYGEILVWFDAQKTLHVVDVTNMRIAKQINKAPYQSPDSGLFQDLSNEFDQLFGKAMTVGLLLAVLLGLLVIREMQK